MDVKIAEIGKLKNIQWYALVLLRVLIGWHFLYEGYVKVINPNWSSDYFLEQSTWIFSSFFISIAESQFWLPLVDFLNQWLLVFIGVFLIAGLFTRTSAFLGGILLLIYYIAQPPLFEVTMVPSEGNYLIVNKLLIESIALFCLGLIPTGKIIGFDRIIMLKREKVLNG
jgi:thiosulfate dehydrogenase [quinone] large subunit